MNHSTFRRGAILPALLTLFVLAGPASAAGDEVLATVNGKAIKQSDVERFRAQRGISAQFSDRQLTDELVKRELVYQQAQKEGLEKKPAVQQALDDARTEVLVSAMVKEALDANPVTDAELRAEYEKQKGMMATQEFKARHILVKSEEEAKSIIAQLNKKANFADLAKKYSVDPGSKQNGGDLGWFAADQMVPPFAAALRSLAKGSYTKTPVQTQFGWHVILLEDERAATPPTFEQVKDRIRMLKQQERIGQLIERLKEKAKIEYAAAPAAQGSAPAQAPAAQ